MKSCTVLLAFAVLVALEGCNGSDLSIVPVTGKITYDGGEWPATGTIFFSPITVAEGKPRRPAVAKFGPDGTFSAMSYKPDDGLIPGTYSVKIQCYEQQPDSNRPETFDTYNLVPKDFTPPDVVVNTSDQSVTVEFDVPKKK